jgi:hypothetical protein
MLRQRRSLHQFHHQGALFNAVNGRDVGMVQRGQHPRFTRESCHAVGILGERFRQNLDGDIAVQLGVGGTPDFTHPARAELSGDPVVSDRGLGAHRG